MKLTCRITNRTPVSCLFASFLYTSCSHWDAHWTVSSGLSTDALRRLSCVLVRPLKDSHKSRGSRWSHSSSVLAECFSSGSCWKVYHHHSLEQVFFKDLSVVGCRGLITQVSAATLWKIITSEKHLRLSLTRSKGFPTKKLNMMLRLVTLMSINYLISIKCSEAQSPKDKKCLTVQVLMVWTEE